MILWVGTPHDKSPPCQDMVIVVVEWQDSTCPRFNPSMKDSQSWSHMSARATDGNYLKYFLPVRPEKAMRRKRKREKIWNGNCKVFCVTHKCNKKGYRNAFCVTRKRKKRNNLTLPTPCISESCIKIKI